MSSTERFNWANFKWRAQDFFPFCFWAITPEIELRYAAEDSQDSNYLSLSECWGCHATHYQQSFHFKQVCFPYLHVSETQVCSVKWLYENGIWQERGEPFRCHRPSDAGSSPRDPCGRASGLWACRARAFSRVLCATANRPGATGRGPNR